MNRGKKAALFRRILVLAAFCAVVTLGFSMYQGRGEKDDFANAEPRLQDRVDEYLALRRVEDWAALYLMTNPDHRARVTLNRFLNTYGRGFVKVHEIRADRVDLDPIRREATILLTTDGEIVPSRLPAKYQRGFNEEHRDQLRRTTTRELDWIWRDGQWFFQMDEDVLARPDEAAADVSFEDQ